MVIDMTISNPNDIQVGVHLDMLNEDNPDHGWHYWGVVDQSDVARLRREIACGVRVWRKSKQDTDVKLEIHKASDINGSEVPSLTIVAKEPIGIVLTDEGLKDSRELHRRQAKLVSDALFASLPGGTMDEMIAELMRRRASILSVPFTEVERG